MKTEFTTFKVNPFYVCLIKPAIIGTLFLAFHILALPASASSHLDQIEYEEHIGTLPDGTSFLMRIPADWNGILIRDLDFASNVEGLYSG
ncbi:MAG: hypothetical protein HKN08_10490, partial [Gammaproteobacteria bacterium]|nr:hypothetical protein [Gammaproteobacteria bacterium]